MMIKKIVTVLLFLGCIFYLCFVFWTNRALYMSTFDAVYWTDKFEHSQWRLSQSHRTIGDDGLYLYEGYRLVQGVDPTLLNPEVPPLGKYLIGASVKYVGNGSIYGFITTTLALCMIFFLAYALSANILLSLVTAGVVAVDPMIASQFSLTMLDGLQLFFLLTTLLCIVTFLKKDKPHTTIIVLTGLSFGLFCASKFPLVALPIACILVALLWRRARSLPAIFIFLVMTCIGYVTPYAPYFFAHHTFGDWVSVQKYILSFYLHSYTPPNIGSLFTTLLFDRYQNIFSKVWETVPTWSAAWPAITLISFAGLWNMGKHRTMHALWLPIAWALSIFLFTYSVIPFWTRYVVTVLPLLYLVSLHWVHKKFPHYFWVLVSMLIIANIISTTRVLFPTAQTTIQQFTYDWRHGYFQDMYENLDHASTSMTREDFLAFGQKILYEGEIEAIDISIDKTVWSAWPNNQDIPLTITYHTRALGPFREKTSLPVVKKDGRWYIVWRWSHLIHELTDTSTLVTSVNPATRGSILDQQKHILAQDAQSYLVWIMPKYIDANQEDQMLVFLRDIFDNRLPTFQIHNRYVENNILTSPIPIGVVMHPLGTQTHAKLKNYPGIRLTPAQGRFTDKTSTQDIGKVANTQFQECCSLLYTTTTYDGISGMEKQFNALLKGYDGGSLQLQNSDGMTIRTLIQKEKKDGKNIVL